MRIRFSLRALLLGITVLCLAIGWLALPTLRARAFVSAMAAEDYAAAEGLFIDQRQVFPGSWKEHQVFEPRVFLKPLTWRDLVHRQRHLVVAVSYGDGHGIASCAVEMQANADGLTLGMAIP